ncbi:MAG: DNA-processing protein DprA [Gammaproteobacteria bacterium]
MDRHELAAWLRLVLTPGVGRDTARRLLAAFGMPDAVLSQPPARLADVASAKVARALAQEPPELADALERHLAWLALAPGERHILTLGDTGYPAELLQIADPPVMLQVLGDLETLRHPRRLAIVGSRHPTPQGQENAREFAKALGEAGVCVVSGLALGVDGAAHEGALDAGAPTIAVVGTGLDRVYPRQHAALARRIATQGALVSEYLLGTPPLSPNFPQRNRIISGLSQGTLVVEAALQSGSLITARVAAEQGREVFAIPGSIHSPQSKGCHSLIRQGAKLVESAQDILEDLRLQVPTATPDHAPALFSDTGDPLLDAMGFDPVSFDVLQARTGEPTPQLQARLLELELAGQVARLPGGLLQRTGAG